MLWAWLYCRSSGYGGTSLSWALSAVSYLLKPAAKSPSEMVGYLKTRWQIRNLPCPHTGLPISCGSLAY